MNENKKDQWEIILEHLKSGRSITSMEAINEYGFTRLSAIIHTLRNSGYNIDTTMIPVKTRYGKQTMVAKYTLIKEN